MHSSVILFIPTLLLHFVFHSATVTELHVLHKPSYLTIQGDPEITDISKFILNLFGVNHLCHNEEQSIQFKEPFKYPKLIALIKLDDVIFETINPTNLVFSVVDSSIHSNGNYLPILDNVNDELVRLSSLHTIDSQPLVYYQKLDNSSQKDLLPSLNKLYNKIPTNEVKDLIFIDIIDSENYNEDLLFKLNALFKLVFDENYLILLSNTFNKETSDHLTLNRKSRAVGEESGSDSTGLGRIWASLVKPTPANYSSIFNLVFWLSLILALTVYAIVVALWHMDPGKDSIIYRVTNPRYNKKDL